MKKKRLASNTLGEVVGQLQLSCEFPSKADLDWMESAVQRHTGGFDTWWKQNRDELSGRQWMMVFISVWEAGRKVKLPNAGAVPPQRSGGRQEQVVGILNREDNR
jgi:hypothetical protein